MARPRPILVTLAICCALSGCSNSGTPGAASATPPVASTATVLLGSYPLLGDTSPVRDPSIVREGATYYLFASDPAQPDAGGYLPIRCSSDTITWSACGHVFPKLPTWVSQTVPGAYNLWAPDISYFNHSYHLYYAASTFYSQVSAIGLATTPTLDPTSPNYKWADQGIVINSTLGDDFNAIDPNIFIEDDGSVWLTYGSFWTGIKQRSIEPVTGMLSADSTVYSLARRPLLDHAVEGASLVHHGSYYYLFISTGHCCEANYLDDDYEEAVGRSTSLHGPFLDTTGVDLEAGGGTVLLQENAMWNAPGGGTAYLDATTGESLLVFHALKMGPDPTGYLWVKQLTWTNDWPTLH